jgi:hypothetical protein
MVDIWIASIELFMYQKFYEILCPIKDVFAAF